MKAKKRIKKVFVDRSDSFRGEYKGWNIDVEIDFEHPEEAFYIYVGSGRGTLYDGWWGSYRDSMDGAIEEALYGSQLLDRLAPSGLEERK